MLSRFISKSSQLNRVVTLVSSQSHLINTNPISPNPLISNLIHNFIPKTPHFCFFSTNGNFGDDDSATSTTDLWNISSDIDQDIDSVFSVDSENVGELNLNGAPKISDPFRGVHGKGLNFGGMKENDDQPSVASENVGELNLNRAPKISDPFRGVHGDGLNFGGVEENDDQPWSFTEGKDGGEDDLFGVEEGTQEHGFGDGDGVTEGIAVREKTERELELEAELEASAKALAATVKGPDRAFGDLIASSGITDEMLDSLIALKDFEGITGLPPLSEIEKMRYLSNTKKSGRGEIERQRLEEQAKARVQKIDEKGRAYGTGRRKCSSARVWIQPGEGKFTVNDMEFDVYFPMLDHRAILLRPFTETKTMGKWDITSTVKGGGTSGQVGAIRLGISRALQNYVPGLRPPLKEAGFLTRDSRIVERKKPGKAKARKSFQWVKR